MRIGAHGKITRTYLGGGVWVARCRYRDNDGVTRVIERRGPADDFDKHGKLAEDALVEVDGQRRAAGDSAVTLDTKIMALVDQHIDRLEEDGRAVRTIDTYEYCAKLFGKIMSGVRVGEATPARLDAAIRSMRRAHGDVMAVQSKTILKGGLHLAVMANVIGANPVRDVSPMQSKSRPVGAKPLTADELRGLLTKLRESEACQRHDLVDPITLFIATGLRISELLGLLWSDIDEETSTLKVSGEVIRAAGKGLMRIDETKTAAGRRTIPLPTFAAAVLVARRTVVSGRAGDGVPIDGRHLARSRQLPARWREIRDALGVPDATSHSFRNTVATLIDDEGLSARIGADHLGHSRISMTQDKCMARGRVHTAVADMLDRAISDE